MNTYAVRGEGSNWATVDADRAEECRQEDGEVWLRFYRGDTLILTVREWVTYGRHEVERGSE